MGINFKLDKIDIQENAPAASDLAPLREQELVERISEGMEPLRTVVGASGELRDAKAEILSAQAELAIRRRIASSS